MNYGINRISFKVLGDENYNLFQVFDSKGINLEQDQTLQFVEQVLTLFKIEPSLKLALFFRKSKNRLFGYPVFKFKDVTVN